MRDKVVELLTRRLIDIYGESPATQIAALQIAGELLVKGMLSSEIAKDNNVGSNADRIRAMSDEELRKVICNHSDCGRCDYNEGWKGCGLEDWLKQPVKEDTK